jgi:hypothetical protein
VGSLGSSPAGLLTERAANPSTRGRGGFPLQARFRARLACASGGWWGASPRRSRARAGEETGVSAGAVVAAARGGGGSLRGGMKEGGFSPVYLCLFARLKAC